MFKLKKPDKGEKILLIGLILTIITDFASTLYFVMAGKGDLEANLLIWRFGWWALPVVILLNIVFVWLTLFYLQKARANNFDRYILVCIVFILIAVRLLVTVNNIYAGSDNFTDFNVLNESEEEVQDIQKPKLKSIMEGLKDFMFMAAIVLILLIIPFSIYKRDMVICYKE